jgi:hypothetical protein
MWWMAVYSSGVVHGGTPQNKTQTIQPICLASCIHSFSSFVGVRLFIIYILVLAHKLAPQYLFAMLASGFNSKAIMALADNRVQLGVVKASPAFYS